MELREYWNIIRRRWWLPVAITLVALVGLRPLRALVRRYAIGRDEFVIDADPSIDLSNVLSVVRSSGAAVEEVRLTEEEGEALVRLGVRLSRKMEPGELAAKIALVPHVRNVDWSR